MQLKTSIRAALVGVFATAAGTLGGCSAVSNLPRMNIPSAKPAAVSADVCHDNLLTSTDVDRCREDRRMFERPLNAPAPREVPYAGTQPVGTVIVNNYTRNLYFVTDSGRTNAAGDVVENGSAIVFRIAIGKAGKTISPSIGDETVYTTDRGTHWPFYYPDKDGDGFGDKAVSPGITNPLNARAIYLEQNGIDNGIRIHGTNEPSRLGDMVSGGCFRMFDKDVILLYTMMERMGWGGKVIVINTPQFEANRIPTNNNLPNYAAIAAPRLKGA